MKTIRLLLIITVITFTSSCKKDFLEKSPTSFITVEDFGKTSQHRKEVLDATLEGLYSTMINPRTGGTGRHDDFGQKGYDIFMDFLSGDLALSKSTYGWYRRIVNYEVTVDFTRTGNYMPWRYYYRIIKSANLIISALTTDGPPSTPEAKAGLGQAKALRAYAYFYLTQMYIPKFDPSTKVLPIYTKPEQVSAPKATTQEVYDLMIKDLTEAITLLDGFNRSTKHKINQDVAKGLLAYVYASMDTPGANKKAKDLAEQVIATGSYTLMTGGEVLGGFNDVNTPGWMWGVDLTTDIGLNLVSWWGQMDVFTYSYQWAGDRKAIDQGLFDAIKAKDIRKKQFFNHPASGYHLIPWKKFYAPDRKIGGQRNVTTDYVFMRIAEMYLLSAEMSAKTGDEAKAKSRLKDLLSKRFPSSGDYAYVDGLSGQDLKDEIYLQTRIELFAEGKSYLALKRNHKTVNRGTNHIYQAGVKVPYDDPRLTFEIPQVEIQNNSDF